MCAQKHLVVDELRLAQREAKGRLGHCLLLFQDCEAMLKAIVASHRLEVIDGTDDREARQARLALATMGMTAKQLVEEVLLAYGAPDRSDDWDVPADSQVVFRSIVRLGCSPEEIERRTIDLRAFVDQRNRLVHCFRQDHDLGTIDGCRTAIEALDEVASQVAEQGKYLIELASRIQQVMCAAQEQFQAGEIEQFFVRGEIAWGNTAIVQAFQEAAHYLDIDGWTNIEAAVAWIAARYPEERPDHYRCGSWRQVLQESGLFDLMSASKGKHAERYRPKGLTNDGIRPSGRTLRLWANEKS